MKKTRETFYTTAQGRLPRDLTLSQCQALDAYGEMFSRVEHHYIASTSRGETINKKSWLSLFDITSRQYNAVKRAAEGKMESQLSNLDNYLNKATTRLSQLEESKAELDEAIAKWKTASDSEEKQKALNILYRKRRGVMRGEQINQGKFERFAEQRLSGRPSICLGSRKLFRAQFHLEENGYASHEEWKADWQAARGAQFFVLGSKDETMGCQGCVMTLQDDGLLTLRLRLPKALEAEHGKHLVIENIQIGYQPEMLEMASAINCHRKEKKRRVDGINRAIERRSKTHPDWSPRPKINVNAALSEEGLAVNYRFVRDNKNWRVLISMEKPELPEIVTDYAKGAIGIDLNADHLAVSEIDHHGNLVTSRSVPLPADVDATSRQNRTAIETACKAIIAYAASVGKPVVIENLDFTFKKANLKKGRKTKYNKMLSTLSYRIFAQATKRQGIQKGVQVKMVNPAYTSFIGKIKYLNQTKGSVHEAAAMVIARRGKGHRDRLPKESRQAFRSESRTFLLPEDNREDDYAVYREAKEAFDKWLPAQTRDLRQRHQDLLERRRQDHIVRQLESELDALTHAA